MLPKHFTLKASGSKPKQKKVMMHHKKEQLLDMFQEGESLAAVDCYYVVHKE